jgi:hypothetical protein
MTIYELLFIGFVGVGVLTWLIGAWAKKKEQSTRNANRGQTRPGG